MLLPCFLAFANLQTMRPAWKTNATSTAAVAEVIASQVINEKHRREPGAPGFPLKL
jgi:hypothetical protein